MGMNLETGVWKWSDKQHLSWDWGGEKISEDTLPSFQDSEIKEGGGKCFQDMLL